VARTVDAALELCGPTQVAIGSDFDGALRMVCDVAALPWVTSRLLNGGLAKSAVAGVMGENALRVVDGALRNGRITSGEPLPTRHP